MMNDASFVNEAGILSRINEWQGNTGVYDFLKSLDQKLLTGKVLEEAIKRDIRCILFVSGGMRTEGLPRLEGTEREDIKSVADAIFMDGVFADLPAERRTEAVSQAAVLADGLNLKHVPGDTLQDDFILNILRKDGILISAVDQDRRTREMYMTALGNNGTAIMYFPEDMITPEIALQAVQNSGQALEFVPEGMRTKELCRAALDDRQNLPHGAADVLSLIPFSDVCMEYLEKFKELNIEPLAVLGNINPRMMTEEMADFAVEWNSECFQLIPDRLKTQGLCMKAVEKDWLNMRFVPDKLTSPEMALNAVQKNGQAIVFVPEQLRTKEVCRIALDNYTYYPENENGIIHLVPFPDVCMEHLEKFRESDLDLDFVFGCINPKIMTAEMAELAVDSDSGCFKLVPDRLKTQELCIKAAGADYLNMLYVPEKMKTKEVCDAALNHSFNGFNALPCIPEKYKTNEYLMNIVKREGRAIRCIAPEKLTHEMCEEAIKTAGSAYIAGYIPYPDVCLSLLRKCPDRDQVREFMMNIKPAVIDGEIARELIGRVPSLIKDLPDHVRDKQLYMYALELDAKVLRYIPDSYKTEELCRNTIKRDSEAITGLPQSLQKHDFYMKLVRENGMNLKYIPREHREKDICRTALDNTYGIDHEKIHIISHIPHSDICLDVIKSNKNPDTVNEIMLYMDKGVIDGDIAKEVVSMDAQTIKYIPDSLKTKEICREAVFSKPDVLGWVPEDRRTPEMCLLAVKSHPYLENFVPAGVMNGNNIFTFNNKLESEIQGAKMLTCDQVLKLYRNEEISIKGLHLCGQSSNEQSLQYLNDRVVIKGIESV
ncbi:MAG: DUF4116 domain-containing protein, partial [Bacteroidales bacterium]|nr:DUF4116 domain-containing protein [Bacteroidales bacterium]